MLILLLDEAVIPSGETTTYVNGLTEYYLYTVGDRSDASSYLYNLTININQVNNTQLPITKVIIATGTIRLFKFTYFIESWTLC